MRNTVMLCALSSSFAHFLAAMCSADTETQVSEQATRKEQFLTRAGQAVRAYRFTDPTDPQAVFELHPDPVLTWTNPAGGDWDGAVFLWTVDGRPAVIVSIYQGYHREGQPVTHEFQSLASGPITASKDGREVWRPQAAGVAMKPFAELPELPEPAKNPKTRLIQMRAIARQFQVEQTDRDGTRRELRLLPQPLFRYAGDDPESDLLDGAIFNFAQATDPEVLLLLEARRDEHGLRWHYGFGRLNSTALVATREDKIVWRGPLIPWDDTQNREGTYTAFFRQ